MIVRHNDFHDVHLSLKKLVLIYSDVYKSVLLLIFETKKVNFAASKVKNVSRYMYVKQLIYINKTVVLREYTYIF